MFRSMRQLNMLLRQLNQFANQIDTPSPNSNYWPDSLLVPQYDLECTVKAAAQLLRIGGTGV